MGHGRMAYYALWGAGKPSLAGFFSDQVMPATKGCNAPLGPEGGDSKFACCSQHDIPRKETRVREYTI